MKDEMKKSDLTVEMDEGILNIRVGAIIQKNGKVLMVTNSSCDFAYSVGGRVKFGESAEEAIVREVYEETGVHMEVERLGIIHENFFVDHSAKHYNTKFHEICFFFYMKVPESFEPVSKEFMDEGSEEHFMWLAADSEVQMYPEFFREIEGLTGRETGVTEGIEDKDGIRHIVTKQ